MTEHFPWVARRTVFAHPSLDGTLSAKFVLFRRCNVHVCVCRGKISFLPLERYIKDSFEFHYCVHFEKKVILLQLFSQLTEKTSLFSPKNK